MPPGHPAVGTEAAVEKKVPVDVVYGEGKACEGADQGRLLGAQKVAVHDVHKLERGHEDASGAVGRPQAFGTEKRVIGHPLRREAVGLLVQLDGAADQTGPVQREGVDGRRGKGPGVQKPLPTGIRGRVAGSSAPARTPSVARPPAGP
ncbi:TPA_asm: UL32.5 [Human alphaherpesvirus 1]|nr:TPA_asm: UL32.5 [Human alphaherpesvirus 1]